MVKFQHMQKLIVANWKLNPSAETEAVRLARGSDAKNAVICPPFPFLGSVKKVLRRAKLGAQDVFWETKGAFTGEVSPEMLKKFGAQYVIVGHSERRHLGETDEMVNKKVLAALRAELSVILCVGEPKSVRRKGIAAAKQYVAAQLKKDLAGTKSYKLKTNSLIIAYEPIWAIGTGVPDKPEESAAMAAFIKLKAKSLKLKARVLYGGSVKPSNAKAFLSQKEIGGALVGGASLNAKSFRAILRAAQ
jgi:triosephosphate isomerase